MANPDLKAGPKREVEELRKDARVAVSVPVQIAAGPARVAARTENLSVHGAMLSLAPDHALAAGASVQLTLELPATSGEGQMREVQVVARVRWASELLPELVGVEFETALDAQAAAWLAGLSGT